MADYIFKDWEKKLSAFESSVEKDLDEIRKCKQEVQQLKVELTNQMRSGYYLRDDQRLVLSAPEVIIGNVDAGGNLLGGGGSTVIVRGTQVGLHGVGEGGTVEVRASGIRQTAEDPGIDGHEHVVYSQSHVATQARSIILQSEDADGTFAAPLAATVGSGVSIRSENDIEIGALIGSETREKQIGDIISSLEKQKNTLKTEAASHKSTFKEITQDMEKLLDDKEKLLKDDEDARSNYQDTRELSEQIEYLSLSLSDEVAAYSAVLSMLSEVNRQLKLLKALKGKVVKGDKYKKESIGTSISLAAESISLTSTDGDGNLRDNPGSGISMTANDVSLRAIEQDATLKKEGSVCIQAKTVEVTTAGAAGMQFEKDKLKTATYEAEGDIIMKAKNITVESVDYEVKESKLQEKQLTADSKIRLRAKTIEVSTEGSANIEVDDKGAVTKANMTAEGDIIVTSKTFTLNSTDTDIESGKPKEKALTSGGSVSIRAEKMDLSATDTEGKATGSVGINAKAVSVKSMDVEKEKRTDDKLAAGSTMTIVSEKMYVGAKSNDVKSKKVQVLSEEVGAFADKTLEIQQDNGKAMVQLSGGNTSIGGSKTQVYGATTINAKTEVKDELKAPKATIDNLEAKTSFKSTNISDGIAVPGAPSSASLSAKLKTEDAPK